MICAYELQYTIRLSRLTAAKIQFHHVEQVVFDDEAAGLQGAGSTRAARYSHIVGDSLGCSCPHGSHTH
jgi:hypothetical protein